MPPVLQNQHHFLAEGPGGLNVVKQAGGYFSNLPVSAPIFDKGGQVYSVKAFYAKGDGITDDTTAFNNAITTATLMGGSVYVPDSPSAYMLNPTNLSNITCNFIGQSMAGVTLKLIGQYNATNDFIRCVSQTAITVGNFTLDGNKSNQSSGTQYGLYMSTTTDCIVFNVWARNFTGVGVHFYNNTRLCSNNTFGSSNSYHGHEFEQNVKGTFTNIHGYSNVLHGVLVSPGEVSGTGSKGNVFTNMQCDGNSQYGLAFNAANGDVSAWLSEGDVFNNVSLTNNSQYGLNIYKQDKQTFNGLYIANNGYFGIYLFESQYNTFNGLFLHNNSQASNGAYDEILQEGYSSNNAHPSKGNVFNGGQIIIDGATKARYCFNEGTANDGPNTFVNINTPNAGTSGTIHQVCPSDIISSPGGVVMIGDNGQAIPGANAGFDSAFTHVLRLYNNFPSGITQIVAPNGNIQCFAGGSHSLDINATSITVAPAASATAGGALAVSIGTGASGVLGVYFGSGAPTISAPQGSLYMRTDGSSTSTRMYINTNGTTGWTAVTTAA